MDWEPCDEELDAINIKKACCQVDAAKKKINNIYCGQNLINGKLLLPSQSNSGILVLDTNVLISCLNFFKELRDTNVLALGYPIFYVPWRVLQELDHLKDSKVNLVDKQLHMNARKAISYLNENFKSNHPRFYGQSFEEFSKITNENCTPDDEILQTCMQLKNWHSDKKVILITNDKNLESKAIICNVEAYSKERFQNEFLSSGEKKMDSCSISPVKENKNNVKHIDNIVCELKFILKELMCSVLETEMKVAFDEDWIKICYKKPPWTLKDALDCFMKHWRSVFFLDFSKEVLSNIEELNFKLFKTEIVKNSDALCETILVAQNLLRHIKISQRKERPYLELVDVVLTKLSGLLEKLNSEYSQVFSHSSFFTQPELSSSILVASEPENRAQETFEKDFNLVKDLFRYIWDSLRDFCGNLSQIIYTPGANNNLSISETKVNLMERNNAVVKFVALIEKILNLNVQDINEVHPVICHLSNFLKEFLPFMDPTLQMNLTKCLAVFFSHSEGRTLLSSSLNDFREFSHCLLKAYEFIDKSYCP